MGDGALSNVPGMTSKRSRVALAAVAGLPLATCATIWLVGDLSYTGPVDGGLDYAYRPLPLASPVVTGSGVASTVALGVVVLWLRRRRTAIAALACLAVAGVLVGLTYRIVTAGVIGANIGAGLALFGLVPLAAVFALFGLVRALTSAPVPHPSIVVHRDGRSGRWS